MASGALVNFGIRLSRVMGATFYGRSQGGDHGRTAPPPAQDAAHPALYFVTAHGSWRRFARCFLSRGGHSLQLFRGAVVRGVRRAARGKWERGGDQRDAQRGEGGGAPRVCSRCGEGSGGWVAAAEGLAPPARRPPPPGRPPPP